MILISSLFLLPSLRETLFMVCCFFLILSYCPFLLCFFFHTISVQKSLWSSPTSLDSVRILSLLFPQKSSVLSRLLILLLCSLILLSCVYRPCFLSSCVDPHPYSHSTWPGVPRTQSWSLSHSLLSEIICMDTRQVIAGTSSFPPLIMVGRHTAFHPLLVIYLTAMKYFIFIFH